MERIEGRIFVDGQRDSRSGAQFWEDGGQRYVESVAIKEAQPRGQTRRIIAREVARPPRPFGCAAAFAEARQV